MNKEALINMLLAMRANIDAMLFLLDSDYAEYERRPKEKEPETCLHKNRLNLTTMGGPIHWTCKDCNYEHKESD